jgi:hypothetical protein
VKKNIWLALVVAVVAVCGLAYAGPMSVVSHSDAGGPPVVKSGDSGVPVQLAEHYPKYRRGWWWYPYQNTEYHPKCLCCWNAYPQDQCRAMTPQNCRKIGGKCQ